MKITNYKIFYFRKFKPRNLLLLRLWKKFYYYFVYGIYKKHFVTLQKEKLGKIILSNSYNRHV